MSHSSNIPDNIRGSGAVNRLLKTLSTGNNTVLGNSSITDDGTDVCFDGEDLILNFANAGQANTVRSHLSTYDSAGTLTDMVAYDSNTDVLVIGEFNASSALEQINFNIGDGNIHTTWTQTRYEFNAAFNDVDYRYNKSGSGQALEYIAATDLWAFDSNCIFNDGIQPTYINVKTGNTPILDFNKDDNIVDNNVLMALRVGSSTEGITGKSVIRALATEAWDSGTTSAGCDLELRTIPNGSQSPVVRVRVKEDGGFQFIAIKTGTLASPPTGLVNGEIWEDTTDSTTHPIARVSTTVT